nr:glycosyltransferase [Desulfobaculum xiamenense]
MVAGRFRPWHGLDVVLARMAEYAGHEPFELHLAGALDADLRRLVIGTPRVAWHGILEPAPLDALLSTADVCFGSMAMHRAGLAEASSIKVRDALARGLPVVAGCADPAFPADFPWYMPLERDWAWGEALERARRARGASRAEVAAAAREHIDYLPVMRRFLADLRGLVP